MRDVVKGLLGLGLLIALLYGYIANIGVIFQHSGEVTGQFVLRVVGIFLPFIGAIMGYF
jgi:hypothetical protein